MMLCTCFRVQEKQRQKAPTDEKKNIYTKKKASTKKYQEHLSVRRMWLLHWNTMFLTLFCVFIFIIVISVFSSITLSSSHSLGCSFFYCALNTCSNACIVCKLLFDCKYCPFHVAISHSLFAYHIIFVQKEKKRLSIESEVLLSILMLWEFHWISDTFSYGLVCHNKFHSLYFFVSISVSMGRYRIY